MLKGMVLMSRKKNITVNLIGVMKDNHPLYTVPFSSKNYDPVQKEKIFLLRQSKNASNELLSREATRNTEKNLWFAPFILGAEMVGIIVTNNTEEHFLQQVYMNHKDLVQALEQYASTTIRSEDLDGNMNMKYIKSVYNLAKEIDQIDPCTSNHRLRTASIVNNIAKRMGYSESEAHTFRLASLLHDVGKFAIPSDIIRKPNQLDSTEWDIMKQHPTLAAEILSPIEIFRNLVPIVAAHHEKYNGEGYPNGLKGDEIPQGARILSVADAFNSMVDGRVYREPLSLSAARSELERCAGSHFDPQVVQAFVQTL